MKNELKMIIKARARLARGLVNLLKDDVDTINIDADNFDLFNIGGSIKEAKSTLTKMLENFDELEQTIYLSKKEGP